MGKRRQPERPAVVLDEWQKAEWVAELKAMVGKHEASLRHGRVQCKGFPTAERKATFTHKLNQLADFLLSPHRVR